MFPAPAGMSPVGILNSSFLLYVPRTRGDEPSEIALTGESI